MSNVCNIYVLTTFRRNSVGLAWHGDGVGNTVYGVGNSINENS